MEADARHLPTVIPDLIRDPASSFIVDKTKAGSRRKAEPLPDDIAVGDHESSGTSAIALRRLLHKLSPAQEEAIRLAKLDGLSVREASARSGQSESLVKVNIHRGLASLALVSVFVALRSLDPVWSSHRPTRRRGPGT